jgi:GDPmannose 4,6-dehydratase
MNKSCVLILGQSGQDGTYMSKLVQDLGHELITPDRPIDLNQSPSALENEFKFFLQEKKPSYIFNFAALATGTGMFNDTHAMINTNGNAVVSILEAVRKYKPDTKLCQASSSEMFGLPNATPQSETTAFNPRTPYGAAKLLAHNMAGIYRSHYNLFACSAILFNHESPLRGNEFVTRKVTQTAAKIKLGIEKSLILGNLETERDWGYAPDYVRGMWQMLQLQKPNDYVLATGITHSIADLCNIAFGHLDMDYRDYVKIDRTMNQRAKEGLQLVGDASKAKVDLNWSPSISFEKMICEMVDSDLKLLKNSEAVNE